MHADFVLKINIEKIKILAFLHGGETFLQAPPHTHFFKILYYFQYRENVVKGLYTFLCPENGFK